MAALKDSLFQRELLISNSNFVKLFPGGTGLQIFSHRRATRAVSPLTEVLEERLSAYGFDVSSTIDRLAHFHQVENTYLSTFQSLGGLGLFLGVLVSWQFSCAIYWKVGDNWAS